MIAMGFDSGFASFGYAVLELVPGSPVVRWICADVWKTAPDNAVAGYTSNARRTAEMWHNLSAAFLRYRPSHLAIEAVAFPRGRMQPTILSNLGRARALVDVAGVELSVPVTEFPAQTVRAMLGLKRSQKGKDATQKVLERRYPELATMWPRLAGDVEHAVDAAAVVLVTAHHLGWVP